METLAKGNAAEAAVLNALVSRGHQVLVPFGGGHPYDLVVDLSPGFLRVQCKAARPGKGVLKFNACSTDHGRGRQQYLGLAELFGIYFPPTGSVYLVPVYEMPDYVASLRLEPTLNNQRKGIRLASDYEIDRWTRGDLREVLLGPDSVGVRHLDRGPLTEVGEPTTALG